MDEHRAQGLLVSREASKPTSVPKQIDALLALERGWDSYDGLPPDEKTVYMAAGLAGNLADGFSYPPTLVPCSDGSVQVEWHCDGWDVEMWVSKA